MKQYIVGSTYGRLGLELLEILKSDGSGFAKGIFRCTCGKEFIAKITSIISGDSLGCGCREGKNLTTHGLTSHPMYSIYCAIKQRCYYKAGSRYKWYGGRGIRMSDEFKDNVVAFIDYVTSLPNYDRRKEDKLSLDRIDNDGNYERGNLRWITQKEQIDNSRSSSHSDLSFLNNLE